MKKIGISIMFFVFLLSCKDDYIDGNTYLPNVNVNFSVNLLLPEGSDLLVSGYKEFYGLGKGIKGVIIFFDGLNYTAFDLACPHMPIQDCSTMTFSQTDLFMNCPCDGEEFSKIDGSPRNPEIRQAARAYLVTKNGNTLYVRN